METMPENLLDEFGNEWLMTDMQVECGGYGAMVASGRVVSTGAIAFEKRAAIAEAMEKLVGEPDRTGREPRRLGDRRCS